ncbi:MAG: hypothetical protein RL404_2673 [Pseudomonadota bacterium]
MSTTMDEEFEHWTAKRTAMGFCAVAEDVETPRPLRELQRMRCDAVQGDDVSRPVDAQDVPVLQVRRSFVDPVFPVVRRVIATR